MISMENKLYGVITAMTTPFDDQDRVSVDGLKQQTEYLIEKGVQCLYPCGTTGEMYLMDNAERELVAETVVKTASDRVPVFIHTGAMRTADTIRLSKHAHDIGASGIGIVTPAYFGATDREILNYYAEICAALPDHFPVYVYVIPQLAKNDISLELMTRIAEECPQVIGVKYSYPDIRRASQYLTVRNGNFSVVIGADDLFFPALSIGCDGVVSGCSGPVPETFVKIYELFKAGKLREAQAMQLTATKYVEFLQYGGNISMFKTILNHRGVYAGHMRKPLMDLSAAEVIRRFETLRAEFPFAEAAGNMTNQR